MKQLLRGGEAAFLLPGVLMLPSGMCGQQEGAETKKVPEFCTMNYGTFYVLYVFICLIAYLAAKNNEPFCVARAVDNPIMSGVTVIGVPSCCLKVMVPSSFMVISSNVCPSATAFHVRFSLLYTKSRGLSSSPFLMMV